MTITKQLAVGEDTQSQGSSEMSRPWGRFRPRSFERLPGWRRMGTAAALAGIVGGVVGAGSVTVFDRHSPAPVSAAAPRSPGILNVPALLVKVLPAVVSIQTRLATGGAGVGTGMVITPDGEVLTNAHLVGGATSITVTRYGTRGALPARLVGASSEDDVALVRIEGAEDLPTVTLGTSVDVTIGTSVVAVGSSLGLSGGTPTASEGIISAEGRSITTDQNGQSVVLAGLFETDAAINPGNSGGPLFESSGRVIGINTAVDGSAQGVGFAIPVDQAKSLLPQLRAGGTNGTPNDFLGIEGVSLTPATRDASGLVPTTGVVVAHVAAGSPAKAAGLLPGDVIVALDGAPITDAVQLRQLVASAKVGQRLQLQVVRGSITTVFTATLVATPPSNR